MNYPLPNIDPSRIMRFEVQPVRQVLRDLKKNWVWITGFILGICMYTVLSAYIATQLKDGFIATTHSAAGITQSVTTLNDMWQAFYFTVINMTTVGFGDIFPVTTAARALAIFNSVFGLIVFAGLVSVITVAFAPSGSDGGSGAGSSSGPVADPAGPQDGDQDGDQGGASLHDLVCLPDHTMILRQTIEAILFRDAADFPSDHPVEMSHTRAEKLRTQLVELGETAHQLEEAVRRYNLLNNSIRKRLSDGEPLAREPRRTGI